MGVVLTVLKWLGTSLLNPKVLACLALLGLVGYGQWRFYDWSYARGVDSQTTAMNTLNGKLTAALKDAKDTHASLNDWIGKYNKFVGDSATQIAGLKADFATTEANFTKQLQTTQAALSAKEKELANETQKYVSAAADAHCTIPLGFVQLYNLSLEGLVTSSTPAGGSAFSLANSPFAATDLPSGLSLSDVTSVIVVNNAAAVANRNTVIGWQTWWQQVQTDYKKAQQGAPIPLPSPQASLLTDPRGPFTDEYFQRPPLAQVQTR